MRVGLALRDASFERLDQRAIDAPPADSTYEFPIGMPVMKTSAPPNATCMAAESGGVSIKRCRTHVMPTSSTITTRIATVVARLKLCMRYGSVGGTDANGRQ